MSNQYMQMSFSAPNGPRASGPDPGKLISEADARDPFLERYGNWIVLGFIAAFALLLIGLNIAGQAPGQSFLLKGTSDILQTAGQWIGFFFCFRVVQRLWNVEKTLKHSLMQMGTSQSASHAALKSATTAVYSVRRARLAWLYLAIGIACYGTAGVIWTSFDIRMPSAQVPYPGLYDVGYVAAYPFFVIGMILLARRNATTAGRFRLLLDALAVIGTALALSWFFLLAPSIAGLSNSPSPLASFLAIYFPAGDLLLIAVGAFLFFTLSTRSMQPVLARVVVGIVCLATADSLLGYFNLTSGFNTGTLLDLLWPLSLLLVGLAAVEYPRSIAREQGLENNTSTNITTTALSRLGTTLQSVVPYTLVLGTGIILLLVIAPRGRNNLIQAAVVSLILVLIISIRQLLTIIENERLTAQTRGELVISRRELQVTRREAEEATHEAAEKQELQNGITVLQQVHARVAGGDLSARAPIDVGPLLPIAQSLNLMLDRLRATTQRAVAYDRLVSDIQALQALLDQLGQDAPPEMLSMARSLNELQPVVMGVFNLQRVNANRVRRLRAALELMRSPLQQLRATLAQGTSIGASFEQQQNLMVSKLEDMESKWNSLRAQTDAVLGLLDGSTPQTRIAGGGYQSPPLNGPTPVPGLRGARPLRPLP